ncbi:MAG: hypothetical protein QM479_05735 [Pseudomonadota bacterium]
MKDAILLSACRVAKVGEHDEISARIYKPFSDFRKECRAMGVESEGDYLRARSL